MLITVLSVLHALIASLWHTGEKNAILKEEPYKFHLGFFFPLVKIERISASCTFSPPLGFRQNLSSPCCLPKTDVWLSCMKSLYRVFLAKGRPWGSCYLVFGLGCCMERNKQLDFSQSLFLQSHLWIRKVLLSEGGKIAVHKNSHSMYESEEENIYTNPKRWWP